MLSEWMALTDIINKYAVSLPTKERQRIPLAAFMTIDSIFWKLFLNMDLMTSISKRLKSTICKKFTALTKNSG